MKLAALPGNVRKHLVECVDDPLMSIGRDHQQAAKPTLFQAEQEVCPGFLRLARIGGKPKYFADPLLIRAIGDHQGLRDNPVVLANLKVGSVDGQERVASLKWTVAEGFYFLVQILAEVGDS